MNGHSLGVKKWNLPKWSPWLFYWKIQWQFWDTMGGELLLCKKGTVGEKNCPNLWGCKVNVARINLKASKDCTQVREDRHLIFNQPVLTSYVYDVIYTTVHNVNFRDETVHHCSSHWIRGGHGRYILREKVQLFKAPKPFARRTIGTEIRRRKWLLRNRRLNNRVQF